MKLYLVNFATKEYNTQQFWNTFSGKIIGGFEKVFSYSDEDIDPNYLKQHNNILSIKKGAGLWLWKPYFIDKTLSFIERGDYLFHCDSSSIFIRNISRLVKTMEMNQSEFMFFDLPLLESSWTKPSLIEYFSQSYKYVDSNQISASFFLIKKTNKTIAFIKEWLEYCEYLQYIDNDFDYKGAHRYDQSILSLLVKKYDLKTFRDPSQYGKFPEMYRHHSKLVPKSYINSNYKTSIILVRKSNWIKELIKFLIKSFLKSKMLFLYNKMIGYN